LSTRRANNVADFLRSLGVKGEFDVRGSGVASQKGATARRVNVSVTYAK
jgi:outer membrane protein OmpA-like peptidoglycan-associated protein